MKIKKLYIKSTWKNLENFIFEDNSSEQMQVIVGQNGTGKSNFLEALTIIFANLYSKTAQKNTEFSYELDYQHNNQNIYIESEIGKTPTFWVNNEKITQRKFKDDKLAFLPQHLITYYSGISKRLETIFNKFEKEQTNEFKKNSESPFMPNFYMRDRHSKLAFLTCMAFDDDKFSDLLKRSLGVVDFENVTFYLKQPYWTKSKEQKEDKFWGTEGIMREILERIAKYAFQKDENKKVYKLSLLDVKAVVEGFLTQNQIIEEPELRFFQALESLYWSDLVENITINVKRNNTSISITELSEGEVQLLLVLGFIRLFRNKECLFLLDEPDTHLNPFWQWQYLDFISTISTNSRSQILMTSHQAMSIGSLEKENVRRFIQSEEKLIAVEPSESPRGMGVAGILTEIFEIPSTLDIATNEDLERRRHVESMLYNYEKGFPIPENENLESLQKERDKLNEKLDNIGFSRVTRDPLYQKFQAAFDKEMKYQKSQLRPLTPEELAKQDELMEQILKELLNEEGL